MLVPSLDYYWPDVARGRRGGRPRAGHADRAARLLLRDRGRPAAATRLVDGSAWTAWSSRRGWTRRPPSDTIEWLAETGIPVVLLERTATVGPAPRGARVGGHRPRPRRRRWPCGTWSPSATARSAWCCAEHSPTGPHVRRGWLEAVTECGIDPPPRSTRWSRTPARPAATRPWTTCWTGAWPPARPRCSCTPTPRRSRWCSAARSGTSSVPGDLSVVAYDDEVAGLFSPPLTAVRPPRRSIGRAAVRLVADRLADPDRPAHRVVISPSLRVRESTAPPPRR